MSELLAFLRSLWAELRCRHDWQLVGYQVPSAAPGIFVRCSKCGKTDFWAFP